MNLLIPIATRPRHVNEKLEWRSLLDAPLTIAEAHDAYNDGQIELFQRLTADSVILLMYRRRVRDKNRRPYFGREYG